MPELHKELTADMDKLTQLHDAIESLLVIMSNSVIYLVTRNSFRQVNPNIPITKTRPPEREDPLDVFEANKRELVNDLITKAKQIEYLIASLPPPEPEPEQAARLISLEAQIKQANEEYRQALARARRLHTQVGEALQLMLSDVETSNTNSEANTKAIEMLEGGDVIIASSEFTMCLALTAQVQAKTPALDFQCCYLFVAAVLSKRAVA
ncbi:hypothetical protein CTheo_3548 [Ceratobasidium theobromae]|uniref:Mediator of RNA polymerase II transcription subunit 21 n=1 Tax=Ceratobasidium theobromae TaxID=1582974 RepID=A0A5N5QMT2_9AGAM|nr:hypothetical protein CTheo_3548 [Ceratobasidium theobromae]